MATTDDELIVEVRGLTGYTSTDTFSDVDLQGLVNTAKEEIRAELGSPDFQFYQSDGESHKADRALFWFTCIATKVAAGEIGNIDINIDEVLDYTDSEGEYDFWFDRFARNLGAAAASRGLSGASSTQIERTDRSYAYERP